MNSIDYGTGKTNIDTATVPADAVRAIRHNDGTLCGARHLPAIHSLMAAGEVRIPEQPDVTGLYAAQAVRVDMSAVLSVQQVHDDDPDTSYLGQWTDDADDWCIIRATGEYVAKVHQRARIIEALRDRIDYCAEYYTEPDAPEYAAKMRARLARIEASGETKLPGRGREYRFFKPADNGEAEGSAEYCKYGLQNWKRIERLNNGDWHYVGITVTVTLTNADGFEREISSGGLWGIESDSGKYLMDVAREQMEEIRAEVEKHCSMPEWNGEFDGNN